MIEYLDGVHEIVQYHGEFKIRVYLNDEDEDYPQHWHPDGEIIMPIENGYKIVMNEQVFSLKEGDIFIIPPGELHELFAPAWGKRLIMQFDGRLFHHLKGFSSVLNLYHPCAHIHREEIETMEIELDGMLKEIQEEYFSSAPLREAAAYAQLIRFFTQLSRKYIDDNDQLATYKHQKQHQYIDEVFKVCHYIDEHYHQAVSLDEFARLAGFSKFHFLRIFKQVMNMTCYEYLIRRRIIIAEQLLIENNQTIMEVAMKSGFSSLATFNRVFKAKNHCTPSAYKSLHRVY